jgi:xylitol oxidase
MTAIHGSGNTNRNLASSVVSLEVVTAAGDVVTFERGQADFDGAVVSLGALGVVTAMTLDLVPRFEMRQDVFHYLPFETVADNFDAVMASAYSLSLFTHWNGDVVDQAWLKARLKEIGGSGVEAITALGSPGSEILALAARLKADAIIVGSHKPGVSDYLIGSTAARVARHANCTVVVDRSALTP